MFSLPASDSMDKVWSLFHTWLTKIALIFWGPGPWNPPAWPQATIAFSPRHAQPWQQFREKHWREACSYFLPRIGLTIDLCLAVIKMDVRPGPYLIPCFPKKMLHGSVTAWWPQLYHDATVANDNAWFWQQLHRERVFSVKSWRSCLKSSILNLPISAHLFGRLFLSQWASPHQRFPVKFSHYKTFCQGRQIIICGSCSTQQSNLGVRTKWLWFLLVLKGNQRLRPFLFSRFVDVWFWRYKIQEDNSSFVKRSHLRQQLSWDI